MTLMRVVTKTDVTRLETSGSFYVVAQYTWTHKLLREKTYSYLDQAMDAMPLEQEDYVPYVTKESPYDHVYGR